MIKKLVAFILFFSYLGIGFSQTTGTDAMLFGDVKSVRTGEHLPYSSIYVKGTNMGTVADGTGHFKLANLPLGKCIIVAQSVGYKSVEKEVLMERGKSVQLFFELEDDVLNLEHVVVTGTRTEHSIKNVPLRTEIITSKEMENKNAYNIFDALEGTPGVRVENQCQSCNFTMVRMQGLGPEHTQVLINGQPVYSGLAGVYGLQQISTIDVSSIEVIKGAGSALYGSSAVAGAINIITKEPTFIPSTTLGLQLGKYGTNRYDISSSMRNEKGNIGVNIFAQKSDAAVIDETGPGKGRDEVFNKDGISDRVASNLFNAGFGLFIDNPFSSNEKLIIRGKSVFEKRQGGIITDDYYKNPLTDGTENIITDRIETQLAYKKDFNENSTLDFSLAFVNHKRDATNDSYLNDYLSTHSDTVPDVRDMRPYLAGENSLTATLTFAKKIKRHSLLAGIQTFFDAIEESGMYVVVDDSSDFYGMSYKSTANKFAREVGFFVQDEWQLMKNLIVVPGIRLDYHNSGEKYIADRQVFQTSVFPETSFETTNINPRIALKYVFSERLTFRANAGTGFRAPYGFSEDLHLCSGSPRVWKSSELEPETSLSFNISADYYGNKNKAGLNIFRTLLYDKIGFTNASKKVAAMGYDYQWENIDDAFVQGIEFSYMANVTHTFGFGIDATYNMGEYKNVREDWIGTQYENDSKYVSRFPDVTGNLKIEYTPPKWSFTLLGNYQGRMYIDYFNSDVLPGMEDLTKIKKTDPFMLFNAKVSREIKSLKIYAGVNNIFNYIQDEKYLDDAAFMYAPVYGTLFYGGISLKILH